MSTWPPVRRRDELGWIALALLAAPALLGAAWGLYYLAIGEPHEVVRIIRPGQPLPDEGTLSTRVHLELLFLVLWVSGLNVLIGGLITGWIWIHRVHEARWLRDALLTVVAVIIGAVPMWAWSQFSTRRAEGAVMLTGSVIALACAYLVVGPRRTVIVHPNGY